MSEPLPEEPAPSVEAPAGMAPEDYEFWDDSTQTYYERQPDGTVAARPYTEAEAAQYENELALDSLHAEAATAIQYLDERIDLCLAHLALPTPTGEETAEQAKVLSDLAAYSAGTLKRLIKVLAIMLNKPI
ncbi:hypothetical protein QCN29_31340 [Streptomyces sp. HNM0663]|uniref:Uncharacterized protein n=1 Tax=Streptomyces chengmaiensis TaxID=3040919 RepID=A0ABT6HWW6_9ACTN|nr:hypothetical protein [Streptomyces chengmaiensis]MDH2393192.1 hypothetical protein [Streptomyces chengmaiensis]